MLNASLTDPRRKRSPASIPTWIVNAEDEDKARVQSAAQAKIRRRPPACPQKRAKVLETLNSEHCTCGCGLTLAQCRVDDPTCSVSLPIAQDLVKKIVDAK